MLIFLFSTPQTIYIYANSLRMKYSISQNDVHLIIITDHIHQPMHVTSNETLVSVSILH